MKVYIVFEGEYSGRDAIKVFSSLSAAADYIDLHQNQYYCMDIEEWEVDETPEISNRKIYSVECWRGKWSATETLYFDTYKFLRRDGLFNMDVIAKDEDHAIKIAQDKLAELKAKEAGIV